MYEQDWAKIQEAMVCNPLFCSWTEPSPSTQLQVCVWGVTWIMVNMNIEQ